MDGGADGVTNLVHQTKLLFEKRLSTAAANRATGSNPASTTEASAAAVVAAAPATSLAPPLQNDSTTNQEDQPPNEEDARVKVEMYDGCPLFHVKESIGPSASLLSLSIFWPGATARLLPCVK